MIRSAILVATVSGLALAAPVAAQDAGASSAGSDGSIVVTATRSRSVLEDVPVSVSVVEEETVNQQLRQNRNILSGLEFVVPGLSVQDSEVRSSCSSC